MRRLALAACLLPAATFAAAAARPAAAQQPAAPTSFTPVGTYDLMMRIPQDAEVIYWGVVVTDSAGKLGGHWVTVTGQQRPLLGVTTRPDSAQVVVRYADRMGPVMLTLRFRGDSVFGEGAFEDRGTYPVRGLRRR